MCDSGRVVLGFVAGHKSMINHAPQKTLDYKVLIQAVCRHRALRVVELLRVDKCLAIAGGSTWSAAGGERPSELTSKTPC